MCIFSTTTNPSVMRKISMLLLTLVITLWAYAQDAAPADFFAGRWEITIAGTPQGDAKLMADLNRVEGQLSGSLSATDGTNELKIPINALVERAEMIEIFFIIEGYDVSLDLTKVDNDNLKGSLVGMFDATARRVPQSSGEE